MKKMFANHRKVWIGLLFVLLSIPLILPYLHSGYFPTHDGEWAVVRLTDMYRELKDLQFPARYSANLNFGYGYPLFEFAYPLPYYIGFVLHLFRINFVDSIKLLFAITVPLSLWGMYLLVREMWKNTSAGIISAVIYVFYPYRLVDLFVRGSIGESISFAIFPFIIYFLLKIHKSKNFIYVSFASIFIASLVMSHNIMAVEFLPVILLFIGCSIWVSGKNKLKLSLQYIITLILGFGLSAFFWIPALSEKNLIALAVTPIADRAINYVHWWQLFIPSWGYGIPPNTDQFTFQLGLPQVIIIMLLIGAMFFFRKHIAKDALIDKSLIAFTILLLLYILLLFPFTNIVWIHTPLFKEINYPWTLLGVIGFLLAILSSKLFTIKRFNYFFFVLGVITILYVLPYAHPQSYVNRGDAFYLTNDATTTSSSEYMPLWVKEKPLQRPAIKFVALNSKSFLTNQFYNSRKFTVVSNSTKPFTLQINIIYYPGWSVKIDGNPVKISYNNPKGVMQVEVPTGIHTINGLFTETPLRLGADIISLISFIFIIIFFIKRLFFK